MKAVYFFEVLPKRWGSLLPPGPWLNRSSMQSALPPQVPCHCSAGSESGCSILGEAGREDWRLLPPPPPRAQLLGQGWGSRTGVQLFPPATSAPEPWLIEISLLATTSFVCSGVWRASFIFFLQWHFSFNSFCPFLLSKWALSYKISNRSKIPAVDTLWRSSQVRTGSSGMWQEVGSDWSSAYRCSWEAQTMQQVVPWWQHSLD